jgi:HAD superfamily hydrolase (TIGR01509 family)
VNAAPCPLELLIFDCDGVLVDSEPIAARSLAAAAREEGLALSADDCLARFTGLSLDCVLAALAADLGRPLAADFRTRLEARDRAAFAAELRAVPDVAAVIARLPFRRCVASSGSPEKIRYTLGLTGLLPLFEPHLFSAREVAAGKPAPDLFLHAAARMGVDPARCLVIEDAEPGVRAARAAGMRVFGFAGGSHRRDDAAARLAAAGAERVFFRMEDLPRLLSSDEPAPGIVDPLPAQARAPMIVADGEERGSAK